MRVEAPRRSDAVKMARVASEAASFGTAEAVAARSKHAPLIAHVTVGLGRGGAESVLRRLMESHQESKFGHRQMVISLTGLGANGAALLARGVEVHALEMRGILSALSGLVRLVKLFKAARPDVVQTWMVHADILGGLAARAAGVPRVIWGVRTTDYSVESRRTRALRWMGARLSSCVPDKIVCAANASLVASREAGYRADKLMVIANGFDVDRLNAWVGTGASVRQSVGLGPHHLVVGCMGRFNPAKDHASFAAAASRVAPHRPDVRFLMVGLGLNAGNQELMATLESTGHADRFILLDERPDAASCLDAMDVFVLSSRTEGFPNALGEAMAMGLPCVSTDVGDAAALLGGTGELVPARDPVRLADAIDRMLELSRAERAELGQLSKARVASEYSIDATATRFALLYKELLVHSHVK
jgi:glycosyltransferase involved in cell wall biosynthesis